MIMCVVLLHLHIFIFNVGRPYIVSMHVCLCAVAQRTLPPFHTLNLRSSKVFEQRVKGSNDLPRYQIISESCSVSDSGKNLALFFFFLVAVLVGDRAKTMNQ